MCAIAYQSGSGVVAQKGQQAGEARVHEQARAQISEKKMRMDLAQINYQATLQKAMMQNQMAIEQEARAKAWELEKMEIASRLDFQQSEQRRIKKQGLFQSGLEQIEKREREGVTPQYVIDQAKSDLASKFYADVPEAAKYLGVEDRLTLQQQESFRLRDEAQALREAEAGEEPELTPYQKESLELRKQAAERQAAKDAETEDPKKMSPNELVSATKFLSGFKENAWDLGGFLGGGKQLHELAVVDEDGDFVRPATVAEKTAYGEVKSRLESGNKYGGLFDPDTSVSGATQQEVLIPKTQADIDNAKPGTRIQKPDGSIVIKG